MFKIIEDGDIESLKLELDNGADVNAKDISRGWTPLYTAARNGHEKVCLLLLDRGANVNAKITGGSTPLHGASQNGNKDVCALLLYRGANLNAKNEGGWTSLHTACYYGNIDVCDLLLSYGADLNRKSSESYMQVTPMQIAIQRGNNNVSELLCLKETSSRRMDLLHLFVDE